MSTMTTTAPPPYDFVDEKAPQEKPPIEQSPFLSDQMATWGEHSATRPIRRLQFQYKDCSARHGTIRDAANGEIIYTSEHRYRKPTITINSPQGGSVATGSSHLITNKFDMEVAGQKFEVTPRKKLGQTATYQSPSFGQTLTWQRGTWWSSGMQYTLLDQQEAPIARFLGGAGTKSMPFGSFGDLEFAEGRIQTKEQRDEVVATGLALAYRAAMNHNGGVTAAVVA